MSYKCYKVHFELEPYRLNDGYPFLHPSDMMNGAIFELYNTEYINWNNVNYVVAEKLLNSETKSEQEYLYVNFGDSELNIDILHLDEINSTNCIIEVGETVRSKRIFINKDNLETASCVHEDNYYYKKDGEKYYFKEYWFVFKNGKDSVQSLSKTVVCL